MQSEKVRRKKILAHSVNIEIKLCFKVLQGGLMEILFPDFPAFHSKNVWPKVIVSSLHQTLLGWVSLASPPYTLPISYSQHWFG